MPYHAKCTILLLLLALLAGCAGPRYQTVYRYEAPTDADGRTCLAACEPKLANCQNSCQAQHQACVKSIEPMVEALFQKKLQQFQRDIQNYQLDFGLYQHRRALGFNHYYPFYGRGRGYGLGRQFYDYGPHFPPTPPFKPERAQIAKQVEQAQCARDCGCQPIYDACFLSCSGKKIPEVKCIANCSQEKSPP